MDALIACDAATVCSRVNADFNAQFTVTDMGEATEFLGVRSTQARETITLDQRTYCRVILTRYCQHIGTRNCTDVPLAGDAHTIHMQQELSPTQQRFCSGYPYAEIMEALMYLCVLTRPDIAYAVGTLTRHMANPTYAACKACSRVLNYLKSIVWPNLVTDFDQVWP